MLTLTGDFKSYPIELVQMNEEALRQEYQKLQLELQNPNVFGRTDYPNLARRQVELAEIIDLFDEQKQLEKLLADTKGVVRNDGSHPGPKAIAWFKGPAQHVLAIIQEK